MSNRSYSLIQEFLEEKAYDAEVSYFSNEDLSLTPEEIHHLIHYILNVSKKRELIENNLYRLNKSQNVPLIFKTLYEEYFRVLQKKQEEIALPGNYLSTVLTYINQVKEELSSSIRDSFEHNSITFQKIDAQAKSLESEMKKYKREFTKEINKSKKEFSEQIQESKVKSKNEFSRQIQKSKDSLITLTVTVLGIFCSLTFSLSGALNLLNHTLNGEISFAESLFRYSLIGFFVSNLVFFLIYTISKLNNKSIAMHCSKCDTISDICKNCKIRKENNDPNFVFKESCHGCEHKNTSCQECAQDREQKNQKPRNIFCKLWHKFFYIVIINIICVAALFFSFLLGITGHQNFIFENSANTASQEANSVNIEYNIGQENPKPTADVVQTDIPLTEEPIPTESSNQ